MTELKGLSSGIFIARDEKLVEGVKPGKAIRGKEKVQ